MISKLSVVTIGFAAILLVGSAVWACPAGPVQPLSLKMRNLEPIQHPFNPIIIEIDGYAALGSEPGDSCGVAPILPEGLAATTISIVHAKTGEPVGFGPFRADARARRGFCGQGSRNCVAFVSRVTQQGIKAGTPLKMIIEALPEGVLDARQLTNLAVRIARASVFVAGGVDNNGNPYHHLSVVRPGGIEIVFPKE